MPCEDYREPLTEAAATSTAPPPESLAHMDSCSACRAFFAEELQLFAAIDTGLHATVNTETPPSLFPLVRAKLSETSGPRRSWISAFAAIAAAAALVVAIVFLRGAGLGGAERNPSVSAAIPSAVSPDAMRAPAAKPSVETGTPSTKQRPAQTIRTAPAVDVADVAVLVPAGQKQAIDALIASIQQGKVEADVLFAEKPMGVLEELQVSPLEISPIEVKPLADISPESTPPNEKTKG